MNAIVGFIHLMEHESALSEKQIEYLQKMRFSSQHLLSLINNVLDISKIESSGIVLNQTPLSVIDQINQVDAVIRPQAIAKQQIFCVKMEKLPYDRVLGDGVRLRQVLMNLLSNAVKYTPCSERIQLEISENSCRRPGYAALRFAVSDNGCGMEPEFAKHVFEPFTREGRAIEKGVQGTGLGMAITKNIVDLMQGQITVVSGVDQGSCFTVTLELPKDDRQLKASGIDLGAEKSKNYVLQGKHFLCAEDNELNADFGAFRCGMQNLPQWQRVGAGIYKCFSWRVRCGFDGWFSNCRSHPQKRESIGQNDSYHRYDCQCIFRRYPKLLGCWHECTYCKTSGNCSLGKNHAKFGNHEYCA